MAQLCSLFPFGLLADPIGRKPTAQWSQASVGSNPYLLTMGSLSMPWRQM